MKSDMDRVRVLVVDDSPFMRRALRKMLERSPYIRVVGEAANGALAIEQVEALRPDVVTMDVKMPVMDGLTALQRIMCKCPTAVVMLSSVTGAGGEQTLRALEMGAVDFIDKSAADGAMEIGVIADELVSKVLMAAQVDVRKLASCQEEHGAAPLPAVKIQPKVSELLLIGTSTGGPSALQEILGKLPASFPLPILVVQHMPVGFTRALAERLDRLSQLEVAEATDGETLQPGHAYIAKAGFHLLVQRQGGKLRLKLDQEPEDTLHRPSVDLLFASAAEAVGERVFAVVLTGMGRDGAEGARAIKGAGGRIIVESEESAIVFGMPRAVMEEVSV
ncbi:MAG TPA: chemotaxis response regulator protein-glutamate methylesterase, partial [Geobacterales bacterium]|nr:chemotaxis response regulator protein-glutamate methylesterase [Geobacterales bacterium]